MSTDHQRRLAGKVAIVTGASSGIGRATALLLAREGAAVCVADVNETGGLETVTLIEEAGGKAIFVLTDVGSGKAIENAVEKTEASYGRLDILHSNAIWFKHAPATDLKEEDWDRAMDMGLKSVYLGAKYAIPVMLESGGGSIVNTGSVHSLASFPTCTAYDAAKAGILGLTRVLAVDYGPEIRVNAVLPGAILTPIWDDVPEDVRQQFRDFAPAGRLGTPEDVAEAVLFLSSNEAAFITGTSLTVDGGLMARAM